MTKPFTQCSLPDFALEIFRAVSTASSALDAAAAALFLRSLARADSIEEVLQRYPLIRESNGLVCTSTAESKQAWCSMLRDLFSASDSAVSDAALFRMYLVIKKCCKHGRVHACAYTSGLATHPASLFASHELVALYTAHPVYCLASQINVKRWCGIFRCRNHLKAQSHHWHATGINIQLQQRQALLRRSANCALLARVRPHENVLQHW